MSDTVRVHYKIKPAATNPDGRLDLPWVVFAVHPITEAYHSRYCRAGNRDAAEAIAGRKNRENLAACRTAPTAEQAAAATEREPATEPVPCPFCDKLFPGVYGQPGVAMLRADNETLICGDCGTREALEGGLRMPVSKFLETYTGSHELYYSAPMAKRLLTFTGHKAPWTPHSAKNIRAMIEARGLGGSYEGNEPGIAGYEMATDLAWTLCQFHSVKNGRGAIWRECIEALRGNGK